MALVAYLDRDPNLPPLLLSVASKLKSSLTPRASAFSLNTVRYYKSSLRECVSESASQVHNELRPIPDDSFMGLPTPSSSIAQESPDKRVSYASQDHTPTRMVFNTIADFLSDEFRDLASPTWTPSSSPTALFQRTACQPLTPRAPPENMVCYIMISM